MLKRTQQCSFFVAIISIIYVHAQDSEDTYCAEAKECVGQDIQGTNTFSRGYKSTSNASIISTTLTACEGAFSCSDASIISSPQINCHGTNACSNVNSITCNTLLQCTGSNSCIHSTISGTLGSDTTVHCWGYKSCANSHIVSVKTIDITAAYAAYSASIYSAGTNVNATFSGYRSALNTNFICQSRDICTINCYGNACYMLYINCATCTINTHSIDTIHPIMNISNFIYPNVAWQFEPVHSAITNDEMCSDEATSVSYDNQQQVSEVDIQIYTNHALCCRGETSCEQKDGITRLSADTYDIICSGDLSCSENNFIKNDGSIYCEGNAGCLLSALSTTNSIYCLGKSSCGWQNTFYNAAYVYCSAHFSCAHGSFYTSGLGDTHHAYFIGFKSGHDVTYHCKRDDECILYCGARDACYNLTVICDGQCTVYCDADSLCPNGYTRNIKDGNFISPTNMAPSSQIVSSRPSAARHTHSEPEEQDEDEVPDEPALVMSHGTAYALFVIIILLIALNVSAGCLLCHRKPNENPERELSDNGNAIKAKNKQGALSNVEKRGAIYVVKESDDDVFSMVSSPSQNQGEQQVGYVYVAKCTDCFKDKLGRIYEGDGDFYCLECWEYYQA